MKKVLFGMAVAACVGLPGPVFAANGSIATAMVQDAHKASARRIELQLRAEKQACERLRREGKPACSGEAKEKLAKS